MENAPYNIHPSDFPGLDNDCFNRPPDNSLMSFTSSTTTYSRTPSIYS